MQLFEKVRPEGPTPTADVLEVELSNYVFKYKRNRGTGSLNLIVITDGEPERGQDVGGVIAKYAKRLANEEAPPLQLGIQFVQIGGDEAASKFLKWLDDDLQDLYKLDRDMVDTVPWVPGDEENLYEKVLLGGILKRLDHDEA